MPAHLKAALPGNSVTIPIAIGRLNVVIWQGNYLGEPKVPVLLFGRLVARLTINFVIYLINTLYHEKAPVFRIIWVDNGAGFGTGPHRVTA